MTGSPQPRSSREAAFVAIVVAKHGNEVSIEAYRGPNANVQAMFASVASGFAGATQLKTPAVAKSTAGALNVAKTVPDANVAEPKLAPFFRRLRTVLSVAAVAALQ